MPIKFRAFKDADGEITIVEDGTSSFGNVSGDVELFEVPGLEMETSNDGTLPETTPAPHTHVEVDITDLDKYTQAEVDAIEAALQVQLTASAADISAIQAANAAQDTSIASNTTDISTIQSEQTAQDTAIAVNTTKISADGGIDTHSDVDTTTTAPSIDDTLVWDGSNWIPGQTAPGIVSDLDPQTNLSATATLDQIVLNTTTGELEKFDGTNFLQLTNDSTQTEDVAAGSVLGLQQQLLADAGQPGLTVLAVGQTNTGRVQGTSLGDGNVVEVYASGADFNSGTVLYREFMSLGEPIVFSGITNGAIITSTQGFYGMSENVSGGSESPMPLLSYGLSFKETFLFAFRNSNSNEGRVWVVNGPLSNVIKFTDGSGTTILAQEDIELSPWEFVQLQTDGVQEYILSGKNQMMACIGANMDAPGFYDFRLVMPLTNDGITWPRSGDMSAPFAGTDVDYFVRDNAEGTFTVNPGSPIAIDTVTGATDADYEPNGATRFLATGLVSAYSGADSAGLEATPLMPVKAMAQVIAQPQSIDDSGDGGQSGIAIASPYQGTAQIFEWNDVTSSLDLAYTVPLTRNGVTITSKEDQKHPAAGGVANEATTYPVQLVGDLSPGVIIADVPITVIVQSNVSNQTTIRSQNGTTALTIINEDDETLMLGITPDAIAVEIREGSDGILYKRVIGAGGIDTWEVA